MMNKTEQLDVEVVAKELGYRNVQDLYQALGRMREKSIEELRNEDLTDLCEIEIDESFPLTDQAVLLLKQTTNPFYYQYEGMIVKVNEPGLRVLNRILDEIFSAGGLEV